MLEDRGPAVHLVGGQQRRAGRSAGVGGVVPPADHPRIVRRVEGALLERHRQHADPAQAEGVDRQGGGVGRPDRRCRRDPVHTVGGPHHAGRRRDQDQQADGEEQPGGHPGPEPAAGAHVPSPTDRTTASAATPAQAERTQAGDGDATHAEGDDAAAAVGLQAGVHLAGDGGRGGGRRPGGGLGRRLGGRLGPGDGRRRGGAVVEPEDLRVDLLPVAAELHLDVVLRLGQRLAGRGEQGEVVADRLAVRRDHERPGPGEPEVLVRHAAGLRILRGERHLERALVEAVRDDLEVTAGDVRVVAVTGRLADRGDLDVASCGVRPGGEDRGGDQADHTGDREGTYGAGTERGVSHVSLL
ncbi:hypothetical protein SDC9_77578 [bioreactor metagenome]|uniref:Uncharacterized protein n=1 Tax=bioreactor metagenome TaxID=1076179 RepID=A0A644YR12_9ZZZZ